MDAINDLLQRKVAGEEMDREPSIPGINAFLEKQINHFTEYVAAMEESEVEEAELDGLFREMLEKQATCC